MVLLRLYRKLLTYRNILEFVPVTNQYRAMSVMFLAQCNNGWPPTGFESMRLANSYWKAYVTECQRKYNKTYRRTWVLLDLLICCFFYFFTIYGRLHCIIAVLYNICSRFCVKFCLETTYEETFERDNLQLFNITISNVSTRSTF